MYDYYIYTWLYVGNFSHFLKYHFLTKENNAKMILLIKKLFLCIQKLYKRK